MSQGSFASGETTVQFAVITPAGIPHLESMSRTNHIPGKVGGQFIDLGKSPRQFNKNVICTGDWDNTSTSTAKHNLDNLVNAEGTLTVHGLTASNVVLLRVEVIEETITQTVEGPETVSKIKTQQMNLLFLRIA